jgi:hypothetical protein
VVESATACARPFSPLVPSPFPPYLLLFQGEIVEGSESDVRAAVFLFSVTREPDAKTGELTWRAAELVMQGAMAYL